MHITMLDNGIDSIQKGFNSYLVYTKSIKGKSTPDPEDYYTLKQAILSTHHGVEILLKYILYCKSEFLIIDEFKNDYKKAYKEKTDQNLDSVFQTSKASRIHTISYDEALERVKYFSDIQLSEQLEFKLLKLNTIRNALTHAEVSVDDSTIDSVFDNLLIELDVLFLKAIGATYKTFYGYSEIKANYDKYMEFLTTHKMAIMKDVVEALSKAAEKTHLYSGQEDIVYIDDINAAKIFFKALQKKQTFGMDLFNGWCSGEARLKIIEDGHIAIWANDNRNEAIIKFKSMIVYIPKIESNQSPVVILESDNDILESEVEQFIQDEDGVKYIDGLYIENSPEKTTYNPEEIVRFQYLCDYEDGFAIPQHYSITRFISQKVFGCFNIQGLPYWDFHKLLRHARSMTAKELAEQLDAKKGIY